MTDASLPRRAAYAPHRQLSGPAGARPSARRLVLGIALVVVLTFLGGQAVLVIIGLTSADGLGPALSRIARADTPFGLLAMLFSMGILGLATFGAARLVQKRGPLSIIGPPGPALRQFGRVFLAAGTLSAVGLGLLAATGEALMPGLPPGTWAMLLPLSALAILVQTGSEEIFFRGYLQSQLAARFRSPLVWILLPSVIFALGHYAATYGSNAWFIALWAGIFGLAAADLTARSGTLGPAMALHFVNNATVLLFVSMQGQMSGLALYQYPFSPQDADMVASALPLDFISLLLGWGAARLALRV